MTDIYQLFFPINFIGDGRERQYLAFKIPKNSKCSDCCDWSHWFQILNTYNGRIRLYDSWI